MLSDVSLPLAATNEAFFRLAFEQSPIGAAMVGLDFRFVRVNAALCRMTGYAEAELLALSFPEITHPDDLALDLHLTEALKVGEIDHYTLEKRYVQKSGAPIWIKLNGTLVKDEHGEPLYFLAMVEDMSERRGFLAALHESERRLRAIIDHMYQFIGLLTPEGIVLEANQSALDFGGLTRADVIGLPFWEARWWTISAATQEQLREAVGRAAQGEFIRYEVDVLGGNNAITTIDFSLTPVRDEVGAIVFLIPEGRDISARKRGEEDRLFLERKLMETQRLESLGVLAGGIAHDFNNILSVILGQTEILRLDIPATSPLHASVEAIHFGARRAADLTQQILAYAGKGRIAAEKLRINPMVLEMVTFLRSSLATGIEVALHLAEELPPVEADPAQLRQVILNLLVNATEAMVGRTGCLTVVSTEEMLDSGALANLLFATHARPGRFVRLTVADTGVGMDRATLERLFDPFYSTKSTGRGLGLAVVQGIVRGHHGAMHVLSEPDCGSTFHVWLPAAQEPKAEAPVARPSRGAILVIDDEEPVRMVLVRMITRLGYTAFGAADGATALELLRSGVPGLIGVLIDLTMPAMPGDVVAQEVSALLPTIPIMLMSGYNSTAVNLQRQPATVAGFLQKPFTLETLRTSLEALSAKS